MKIRYFYNSVYDSLQDTGDEIAQMYPQFEDQIVADYLASGYREISQAEADQIEARYSERLQAEIDALWQYFKL